MKPSKAAETHVVIAGGGIAGMTAAMILAEANVRVTLCEAAPEAGGKAKSLRRPDGHPTEHSLRMYWFYYQTLLTLIARIPTENGRTVLHNLVGVSLIRIYGRRIIGRAAAPVPLERGRPTFARKMRRLFAPLQQLGQITLRSVVLIIGLTQRRVASPAEVIRYLYAHLRLLWMCGERRVAELGDISYADYLQMSRKSPQAQMFFSALPRIFVAARPDAEAAAIADMILKGLFNFTSCPPAINNVTLPKVMMMDGPTSERMIDPWIHHLQNLGVDIHFNTNISDLEFEDGRITGLTSTDRRRFGCDYAIIALPYLTLREMAKSDHVKRHLPHLAQQHAIALESSSGIQCFLRDIPATWPSFMRPGVFTAYLGSEWSLVSVLQGEGFWRNVRLPEGTKYVLSITWSDVDKPGRIVHRPASECTPDEILTECLAQCGIDDRSQILGWENDYELRHLSEADYQRLAGDLPPHLALAPARGMRMVNLAPLAIQMPGAHHRSPRIRTEVPNLFLAGEVTYSPGLTLFVPTMEKAASSGHLAASQILSVAAPDAMSGLRMDLRDPAPFAVLRRVDRWIWHRRRPRPCSDAIASASASERSAADQLPCTPFPEEPDKQPAPGAPLTGTPPSTWRRRQRGDRRRP